MASEGALDYDEDGDIDNSDDFSALSVFSSVVSAGLSTSQFTLLDTKVAVHTCS